MNEILLGIPVTTLIGAPDASNPTDLMVLRDATGVSETATSNRVTGTNVWSVTFTPNYTGVYTVFAFGKIQEKLLSLTKKSTECLQNIEDEALGSWSWDKGAGTLILLRPNGTELARFDVTDSSTLATRERTS